MDNKCSPETDNVGLLKRQAAYGTASMTDACAQTEKTFKSISIDEVQNGVKITYYRTKYSDGVEFVALNLEAALNVIAANCIRG